MKERMMVNYDKVHMTLEYILKELQAISSDKLLRQILGHEVEVIKNWQFFFREKFEEPFNIVVIGDFKMGKSTLINALLGKKVVPRKKLKKQ